MDILKPTRDIIKHDRSYPVSEERPSLFYSIHDNMLETFHSSDWTLFDCTHLPVQRLISQHPSNMASTTVNNELFIHLLSNHPKHESDNFAYDEECCMPDSLKVNVSDEKEEESDDDSSQCTWWRDKFVNLVFLEEESDDDSDENKQSTLWNFSTLVVLPTLLFSSFGEAFYLSSANADTGLRWSVVNYSIVMFVIIATLYRRAIQECKITYSVALLLPEILADIVLGLVLCGQVVPAFWFLLSSILCLAIFGVASSIGVLVVGKNAKGWHPICAR
jgi:hypothetical protein